jgi:soluble lytic murein transglycosylase-like protein
MFDDIIHGNALTWNVPESWIKAIIQTESSFNPDAYRAEPKIGDASYGLMQLLSATARGLGYVGAPEGLYDPATNIFYGTKLIAQLRSSYGDDFRRVYSAYNSGRPDLYVTSSQVAANVSRALHNLEQFIVQEPLIVASGGAGALLVGILLLFWAGKGKR